MNFNEHCDGCKEYDHERHCCPRFNRVIETTVKDIQQRWIPCSERLPENKERVLVTCKCSHGLKTSILRYAKDLYKVDVIAFEDKRGEGGWYDYDSEYGYYNITGITAWMPLPDAYEGWWKMIDDSVSVIAWMPQPLPEPYEGVSE